MSSHVPDPRVRLRPEEVLVHRGEAVGEAEGAGDVWVTVFGQVLDVSDLASAPACSTGCLAGRTLRAFAGKDVSHCFDRETRDVVTFVHPSTGERTPTPMAAMLVGACACACAAPGSEPCRCPTRSCPSCPCPVPVPWWRDPSRLRGWVTERSRPIRIVDSFTSLGVLLWVCSEDTLGRVLERYSAYNSDVGRYECVRAGDDDGRPLDRDKTLLENGVEDERDLFALLGLPEDLYVPALLLIRRDDDGDGDLTPRARDGRRQGTDV